MSYKVYFRCSTEGQDFLQQQKCVNDYLTRLGITATDVITEKVSGTVSHKDRKLSNLLADCKAGDVVYVSELSRLGRCMADLFAIVSEATSKGVTLVQCKDGSTIEAESIGGKALLFALSLAAEIEVANIRQRTQMALDARKELIARDGGFVSKSGKWCTKLGAGSTENVQKARIVSSKARTDARLDWLMSSTVCKYIRAKYEQGMSFLDMVEDLGRMYEIAPDIYCTRKGCAFSKGSLWKVWSWCKDQNFAGDMSECEKRNS